MAAGSDAQAHTGPVRGRDSSERRGSEQILDDVNCLPNEKPSSQDVRLKGGLIASTWNCTTKWEPLPSHGHGFPCDRPRRADFGLGGGRGCSTLACVRSSRDAVGPAMEENDTRAARRILASIIALALALPGMASAEESHQPLLPSNPIINGHFGSSVRLRATPLLLRRRTRLIF